MCHPHLVFHRVDTLGTFLLFLQTSQNTLGSYSNCLSVNKRTTERLVPDSAVCSCDWTASLPAAAMVNFSETSLSAFSRVEQLPRFCSCQQSLSSVLFFFGFKVLHCLQSQSSKLFFFIKVGLLAVFLLLTLLQAVVAFLTASSSPSPVPAARLARPSSQLDF